MDQTRAARARSAPREASRGADWDLARAPRKSVVWSETDGALRYLVHWRLCVSHVQWNEMYSCFVFHSVWKANFGLWKAAQFLKVFLMLKIVDLLRLQLLLLRESRGPGAGAGSGSSVASVLRSVWRGKR